MKSRKWTHRLFWAAAACLGAGVLAVGVGWFVLTRPAFFRAVVLRPISRAIGAPVTAGTIRFSPLSGLNLEDIRVGPASSPLLEVRSFRCRYRVLPLLQRRVEVTELTLNEPCFRLVQSPDGEWRFPRGPRRPGAESARPERTSGEPGLRLPVTVDVRGVRIANGRIEIVSKPGPGARFVLRRLNLDLPRLVLGRRGTWNAVITASADVCRGTDIAVRNVDIRFEADAVIGADALPERFHGRLSLDGLEGRVFGQSLAGRRIRAEVQASRKNGTTWDLTDVRLEMSGPAPDVGGVRFQATGAVAPGIARLQTNLAIADSALLNLGAGLAGCAVGNARLAWAGTIEAAPREKRLQASGRLTLQSVALSSARGAFPAWPASDVETEYDVELDARARRLRVRSLALRIRQEKRTVAAAAVSRPATLVWGGPDGMRLAPDAPARVSLSVDRLPVAPAAAFLPPPALLDMSAAVLSGKIDAQMEGEGARLATHGDVTLDGVVLRAPQQPRQTVGGSAHLQFDGVFNQYRDLRVNTISLAFAHKNTDLLRFSGRGVGSFPSGPARIVLDSFALDPQFVRFLTGASRADGAVLAGGVTGRAAATVSRNFARVDADVNVRTLRLRLGDASCAAEVTCRVGWRRGDAVSIERLTATLSEGNRVFLQLDGDVEIFPQVDARDKTAGHVHLVLSHVRTPAFAAWVQGLAPALNRRNLIRDVSLDDILTALSLDRRSVHLTLDAEHEHSVGKGASWTVRRLALEIPATEGAPAPVKVLVKGSAAPDSGTARAALDLAVTDESLLAPALRSAGMPLRLAKTARLTYSGTFEAAEAWRRFHVCGTALFTDFFLALDGTDRPASGSAGELSCTHDFAFDLSGRVLEIAALGLALRQGARDVLHVDFSAPVRILWGGKRGFRGIPSHGTARITVAADRLPAAPLVVLLPEALPLDLRKAFLNGSVAATIADLGNRIAVNGRVDAGGIRLYRDAEPSGVFGLSIEGEAAVRDFTSTEVPHIVLTVRDADGPIVRLDIAGNWKIPKGPGQVTVNIPEVNQRVFRLLPYSVGRSLMDSISEVRATGTLKAAAASALGRVAGEMSLAMQNLRLAHGPVGVDTARLCGELRASASWAASGTLEVQRLLARITDDGAPLLDLGASGRISTTGTQGEERRKFRVDLQVTSEVLDLRPLDGRTCAVPTAGESPPRGHEPPSRPVPAKAKDGADSRDGAGVNLRDVSGRIVVDLQRILYRKLTIRDYSGRIEAENGVFRCPGMDFTLNGAPVHLDGSLAWAADGPGWSLTGNVRDLSLPPMIETFTGDATGFAGSLTRLDVRAQGTLGPPEEILRSLDAKVSGGLHQVVIPTDPSALARHPVARLLVLPFDVVNKIGVRTGLGRLTAPLARLSRRSRRILEGERKIRFDSGRFRLEQRDGQLHIREFELVNPILPGLTFDGSADFRTDGARPFDPLLRLRIGFRTGHLRMTIPVRGTLRHPRPAIERFGSDLVRNIGNAAYDTAVDGLNRGRKLDPFRKILRLLGIGKAEEQAESVPEDGTDDPEALQEQRPASGRSNGLQNETRDFNAP